MREAPAYVPSSTTFSIVVGLDFTEADGSAFDQAARLAQRIPETELHLIHVFPEKLSAERSRELISHLRLYASEKAAVGACLEGVAVGIHLRSGKAVRELVQFATEADADLLVVGSHRGPHLKNWIVGSTAEKLVRGAPCPVLIASPKPADAEPHVPEIEPPCPLCVQARFASHGEQWWCVRHSHSAQGAHVYSYTRELPLATHDSAVIPTGVDF